MTTDNTDNFLLSFLEKKYKVQKDSQIYEYAKQLLQALWKGSICIEAENVEESEAIGKPGEECPLIYDSGKLYIQKYFVYQTRILHRLKEIKFHIITGGPGTGKTTSLANILKPKLNEKILLAAPTGKAAARMKESLKNNDIELEAVTIHRLLGYQHLSVNFKRNRENPLDANIIAIDECSMIDLPMMAKLLDAVPNDCDLYLLGDKNQLASVEAGSVFADICKKYENENKDTYNLLKENWRAKDAPGIVTLSTEILENSAQSFENENVHYKGQLLLSDLIKEYESLFSAKDETEALGFLKKFQILCATKTGKNGAERINAELLSKAKNAKFTPIIITENNYQLNLFNGDVGVKTKEQAYFASGTFQTLTLPKYESAFAITIHKSQGSEYEKVAVVYPDAELTNDEILTRELLYTAITRAKKECSIYGREEILKDSCKKSIKRASGI